MEKPLGLLSPETVIRPKVVPRLRLLLELEPRSEVFLRNLKDSIFHREPEPITISSPPGEFWHDVFVPTELPWKSFQESMLWHMVVMLAAWALTQAWAHRPVPRVNQTAFRASGALYYTPPANYPSTTSRPARSAPRSQPRTHATARGPKAMPVAPERRGAPPALVVPPDLKMAIGNRAPNLVAENTMPSVPLSATVPTNRAQLGGLGSVVAPPAELGGRGNRLTNGLQSSVVAPPADVAGIGGQRSLSGPGSTVVAPPPDVQSTARGMGKLGGGNAQVIAPPPSAQGLAAGSGRGTRAFGVVGAAIVPPPPSIEHSGRAGTVSGPGSAVVPPPPSVQGAGLGGGLRAAGAPGTAGSAVVPPPPSTQGSGGGVLAALSSFFSGSSSKIVPPPPGIQGTEGSGGRGSQMGSLGGGGSSVVPPPPAMQGGGKGRGGVTSLGSGGSEVVPPPPSLQGAGGNAGRGGAGGALAGGSRIVPPPPSIPAAGSGRGTGSGAGTHGGGSLSSGAEVVAPPPSIGNGTEGMGAGGNGRLKSLGGGGQVVPPPPNLQGSGAGGNGNGNGNSNGNGNGGRAGSLIAGGGNVVGPPPSLAGEGNGGGGGGNGGGGTRGGGLSGAGLGASPPVGTGSVSTGPLEQMDPLPDVPDSAQNAPAIPDNSLPPGEDVPLRLIPVPGGASRSSFFSNYEVVLAERTVSATQKEYIKLVYISLPYQKRLSEYDWSSARIYKLRVVQDPKCDESLMEMMMPEGGGPLDPETEASANRLASEVSDKNMKLHCYRTTADDFQRAMTRR